MLIVSFVLYSMNCSSLMSLVVYGEAAALLHYKSKPTEGTEYA